MLYVFEGIDGAGKTTIAKEVSKITGIPYYNCFHNDFDDFVKDGELHGVDESYADFVLIDLARQTGINLIVDRSYPSGWVYTQLGILLPGAKPPLDRLLPMVYPGHNSKAALEWAHKFSKVGIMFWIRSNVATAARRNRKQFKLDVMDEIERLYEKYFNTYYQFDMYSFDNTNALGVWSIVPKCSAIIKLYLEVQNAL